MDATEPSVQVIDQSPEDVSVKTELNTEEIPHCIEFTANDELPTPKTETGQSEWLDFLSKVKSGSKKFRKGPSGVPLKLDTSETNENLQMKISDLQKIIEAKDKEILRLKALVQPQIGFYTPGFDQVPRLRLIISTNGVGLQGQ